MSAPHFRTDQALAAQFDARVSIDPRAAVHLVLGRGLALAREDVPTPHIDRLTGIRDRSARGEYALAFAAQIAKERGALALVGGQDGVRAQHQATIAAKKSEGREQWTATRAAALEMEWWQTRRAAWRAQAEAEAVAKFDPPVAAPQPEPQRAKAQRKASA